MNKLLKKTKKGFTLVELLVVIAILAVLASVSVVGYLGFTTKARNSNALTELTQAREVIRAELLDGKNEVFSFEDDTLYVIKDAKYTIDSTETTASDATNAAKILQAEFTATSGYKYFSDAANLGGTFYFVDVKADNSTTATKYSATTIVYTHNGGIATWTMGSGIDAGGTVPTVSSGVYYTIKS